jgi:uncharacterized protein involved in type VI secretion and phage assembly
MLRSLAINPQHTWRHLTPSEAISQPYRVDVELISERPDLVASLLHQRNFLALSGAKD